MNSSTSEIAIRVTGEPYTITVYQEFAAIWVAEGDFRGERLKVKAPTEGLAVGFWRESARRKAKSTTRTAGDAKER
jgi:hypothetical protein